MLHSSSCICLEMNFVIGHGEIIIHEIYGRFVYIIVCIISDKYGLPAVCYFAVYLAVPRRFRDCGQYL